jgi:hypothetical protein
VGQEDPLCTSGNLHLMLIDPPEMPGIPHSGHREAATTTETSSSQ